ncbi:TetR/AcrR family transcriptional regulator [Corynebacterium godavarianum]|uniref:TetR/AcrR family transcriptional regulator n=2 Tax=Corynebacterium TaxID=1716 RepID=A0ABY3E5I6_9CORY|nr:MULTISPECIES: TetR/AcrR family transcriptional regulator [Corynebacterium]MBL7284839.1 TetR/AcrR family transcriptional regulator [Corynebacterium godavarianum]PAT07497.1 TetR family transcriptional regulator [Corynebacterium hadale]PAT11772.1 TetR family transcriptional regulator [Corynebacterium hadale]PAT12548.1 TetR family transcriptional regulator [Corynebacterium hadale]TSJ74949.1 TetR/AcrR family transcriptional regulator [Corynebacterium godavarianum]
MAHIDRDAKGNGSAKKLTTEERIYASVLRIAQREGFSATSIDAVVADSGVAKTTIYRRYADRKEMLVDALDNIAISIPNIVDYYSEDDALTKEAFREYITELGSFIEDNVGTRVFGSLIASADPLVVAWRERFEEAFYDRFIEDIEDAQTKGTLRPEADPGVVGAMVVGAVILRSTFNVGSAKLQAKRITEVLWPVIGVS